MVDLEMLLVRAFLLARVIAGESGVCGVDGKLAVAHVWQNRSGHEVGWYGSAQPSALDVEVALMFQAAADPTHGARYLLGTGDREKPAVQQMLEGRERTAVFRCAGGVTLEAWR